MSTSVPVPVSVSVPVPVSVCKPLLMLLFCMKPRSEAVRARKPGVKYV